MKGFENEVRSIMKENHWLVLPTKNEKGVLQSSVVLHANDGNVIYVLPGKETLKARKALASSTNIRQGENL